MRPESPRGLSQAYALDGLRAQPSTAALERTTLVFGQAAPHAGILAGFEGPREAWFCDRAPAADRLGLLDLQ